MKIDTPAFVLAISGCLLSGIANAQGQEQASNSGALVGFTVRAYPAGIVPGVHAQTPLTARSMLFVSIGLNFTDRRDWGVHDSEQGSGPGAGIGLRHYLTASRRGAFLGLVTELWFLKIDWTDADVPGRGVTDVVVLQPTFVAGYDFTLSERMLLAPSVALGREFNVRTKGAEVGQGAILLLGMRWSYRLPPA